jgi:hypothetical protein
MPRIASAPAITATLLAVAVLGSAPASAQDRSALSLRLPASTRALATGNAFPLGTRDSDAIFYNPAFGDGLRGMSAAVQWFGEEATFITASAGIDWWRGAVGIGVRSLSAGQPAGPAAGAALTEAALRAGGLAALAEQVLSVAYAQRVRGIRLGATGHMLQQRHAEARGGSFALDIAAGRELGPVRLGLAARNIGPGSDAGGVRTPLPTVIALQAGTLARPTGPFDIALAATVGQRLDAAGGFEGGGGVEVSWWPIAGRTFSARLGGQTSPAGESRITLGGGFTGDRLALDYAWRGLDDGGTHRVGLRLR